MTKMRNTTRRGHSLHKLYILNFQFYNIVQNVKWNFLLQIYSDITNQPSYQYNIITVQPPRSTRSSSLVTLARRSALSSLRITDRSFLQLHNFDLFGTCRTSSFCTAAWQLARFQLTRQIVQSLGDSWASCCFRWSWLMPAFERTLK